MELSVPEQIFEKIRKSNRVLIALPKQLNADTVSSGLGLSLYLKKLGKEVFAVSESEAPEQLAFLPQSLGFIQQNLPAGKDFVITLDTMEKPLDELSYQVNESHVDIFLKSKAVAFSAEDLAFSESKAPFDCLVLLGCQSLESLGSVFESNAEVFYQTPKINIDYHASNEYFGSINLVDVTASSLAEILTSLLAKFEQQLIDEDIATCFLSGIIANTNSFQHVHTTPQALLLSAELVNLGGRQQDVIKHLFKTKSLSVLQLWGRALARVKAFPEQSVLYSALTEADFTKTASGEADILTIVKELLENINGYQTVVLLAELPGGPLCLIVAVHPPKILNTLFNLLGYPVPTATPVQLTGLYQAVYTALPDTALPEAEAQILGIVHLL